MRTKAILGVALAALMTTGALAASTDLWVHVKVDDGGERVRVNIPLSLVENMLPLVNVDPLREGKLRIDDFDVDELEGVDVQELYKQVRAMGDAEFVAIQTEDGEDIRVYKEGDFIKIRMRGDDDEEGFVRIPLDVVGALFSGDSGELDLMAALQALGEHADGDLVQINDGDTRVRIWIDRSNLGE